MSLLIGLVVASVAGFGGGHRYTRCLQGGLADQILMRVIDVTMALPSLPLLIVISAFMGPSIANVIFILILWLGTTGPHRPVSDALGKDPCLHRRCPQLRGRFLGNAPEAHIPEVLPKLFVLVIGITSHAIVAEAGLAILGLGDPTSKSWGMMLNYATSFRSIYFTPYWQWWLIPPLVALIALLLCLAFIGRDLERVLDPKLRARRGAE